MPNNINKILKMDYNAIVALTRKENIESLRSVVQAMSNTANRRIRTLEKDLIGQYSPALKNLHDDGINKFNVKDLNKLETNDLMKQYGKVKKFLQAQSSTLSGWKKIRTNIGKRTGAKKLFGTERKSARSAKIWQNREKRFWDLYNKLKDNYGAILTQLDSDRIQQMLSKVQTQRNKAKTDEDISMAMVNYIDSLYRDANMSDKAYLDALKTEEGMEEVRIAYAKIA